MKRYGLFILLIAGAVVAVSAAAQNETKSGGSDVISEPITSEAPPPEPACFNVRDIDSFSPLSDRFVWIEARRDEGYLLTIDRACFGLRSAQDIAISNHMNRVCANSQAKITFVDFGQVEECVIRTIETVSDRATAEMIVERRRQQD
ncbi:MAG TPA: DUF6491 family protein [Gammaproteobacteria bacterium]